MHTITRLGDECRLQALAAGGSSPLLPTSLRLRLRSASSRSVDRLPFAEKFESARSTFSGCVTFPAQPVAQFFDGDVDVDDFVGAVRGRCRGPSCRADSRQPGTASFSVSMCWIVDRCHDSECRRRGSEDVVIALLVPAAWHIGVRELVDHAHLRLPGG